MKEKIQIIIDIELEKDRGQPAKSADLLLNLASFLKEYNPVYQFKSSLFTAHVVEEREHAYMCIKCGRASGTRDGLVGGICNP